MTLFTKEVYMKTALIALTSGIVGFLLGTTVEFVKNFDNNYEFDLEEE